MKKKNMVVTLLLILGLLSITLGVTVAFFNYTRTGTANVLAVGRIYFNSSQGTSINLTNVFPVKSTELENNPNVDSVTLTITGDTTYNEGLEYLVSADQVVNTVSGKQVPIGTSVTVNNLGTADDSYFVNRGGNSSIYKVLSKDNIKEDEELVVGYITKGATGVNGTVTVLAWLDGDKIAITDTYDGNETDNMGTTTDWVDGRTVLTTEEWNSLNSSGITFKLRVEANEGIWVEEPLTGSEMVRKSITAKINAETNACNPIWVDNMDTPEDETDDITYFSGTNDCVDMNYVWYSGKLWRITAIYHDGSMKLVTQNNITSIAFNESDQVNFWTDSNNTSYMYQWLNEDFYDTLYNASELIDATKLWNATMPNYSNNMSSKPGEIDMVTANVGSLNSYEYYNSYRCINSVTCTGSFYYNGFLNHGYDWRLINKQSNLYVKVITGGNGNNFYPEVPFGIRPSINLLSEVKFVGGGTIDNPYKIIGDKDIGNVNELINTRLSGEYVKLNESNEQIFRIIGVEDNKTKIIAMDYADNKATRRFAANNSDTLWGSGTTTDADTWYTYLNSTYYPNLVSIYGNMFDNGTYYLGTSEYNYKLSVCANTISGNTNECTKTNYAGTFNIGLPRYGEMFATQQGAGNSNSIDMWLMNRYSLTNVWYVYTNGGSFNGEIPTKTYAARPTLHLKSTVKILSGSGTESDPYVVGL